MVQGGTMIVNTLKSVIETGRPGAAWAAPAEIDFDGDVAFGPASTLTLELFGLTPGSGHDRLNVAGSVDVDGSLSLVPGGGFVPAPGDSVTLMTWASRSGEFGSVDGVQQPGGVDLALRYGVGAAVVLVVLRGDVNGDGFLTAADTAIATANQGLATTTKRACGCRARSHRVL